MNLSTILRNSLLAGVAGVAGFAGLTALISPSDINKDTSNTMQQAVLTQEQIQYAKPISFSTNNYPVMDNSQLKKEEKLKNAIPPAPTPKPAPEVRLQDPSEFIKDSSPQHEPTTPKTPLPEPKPDLRHIKPEPLQQKPVYDFPAPAPQSETVKKFNDEINLYESRQIHKFVSKLSLPQFPLATVCVEKRKKSNPFQFFSKNRDGIIAEAQYTEFQPEIGMNFIDTRSKLEALATGIARRYQPANLDSKAFEKLAEYTGLDFKFVERIEGTRNATVYDSLAQFSAQYADSLTRHGIHKFTGLVIYKTTERHLHVTGNAQEVKQIKHK